MGVIPQCFSPPVINSLPNHSEPSPAVTAFMTVFTVTADTIFAIAPSLNLILSGLWPQPSVRGDRQIRNCLLKPCITAFFGKDGRRCGRSCLVSVTTIVVIKLTVRTLRLFNLNSL